MSGKKLTDNEIIKALECCSKKNCKQCPNFSEDIECSEKLINLTLDLITRQQAKIERLTAVKGHIDTLIHRGIEYPTAEAYEKAFQKALEHLYDNVNAKTEAYKEFAERVKEFMHNKFKALDEYEFEYITERDIDNLVKERVGEDNAKM